MKAGNILMTGCITLRFLVNKSQSFGKKALNLFIHLINKKMQVGKIIHLHMFCGEMHSFNRLTHSDDSKVFVQKNLGSDHSTKGQ